MKKILALAFIVFTMFTAYQANATKQKSELLSLSQVEALSDGEGTTLPEVTITCSGGSSGTCFATNVEYFGNYCNLTCYFTGKQDDYCSEIWNLLLEFCINYL